MSAKLTEVVLMHLMALGTFWLIAAGQLVYTTLKPS